MKIPFPVVVGMLLSTPLFFEIGSPIFIATSGVAQGGAAFPFSFLISPILILSVIFNFRRIGGVAIKATGIFLSMFVGWSLILIVSVSDQPTLSLLYTGQWIYPFLWLFYFFTLRDSTEIRKLLTGIFYGATFGAFYYALAGILEILFYGSLSFGGRMTQNLVLPGQYQTYVYAPTAIAYYALISIAFFKYRLIKINSAFFMFFIAISFLAIVFTGAREAVLVFVLGFFAIYFVKSQRGLVLGGLATLVTFLIFSSYSSAVFDLLSQSDIGVLKKLGNLSDSANRFSSRDVIAKLYWNAILDDPIRGSAMQPPEVGLSALRGLDIPSAHNLYIDAFAWGGIPHFVSYILFASFLVFKGFKLILNGIGSNNNVQLSVSYLSFLLILFLIVSNSINVPLRQPLTGPMCMFLIFWIFKATPIRKNIRK